VAVGVGEGVALKDQVVEEEAEKKAPPATTGESSSMYT
jgi:hypothetical protein